MLDRLKTAWPDAWKSVSALRGRIAGAVAGALPRIAPMTVSLIALALAAAPLQAVEGSSSGVDRTVRYLPDADKLAAHYRALADNIDIDVLGSALQGTIYKTSEGEYQRHFELIRLDTLTTEQQASESAHLAAFQKWQDARCKRATASLRKRLAH